MSESILGTPREGPYVDFMKNGTMFVVSRMLSGKPMSDVSWQSSTLYSLLGFVSYHFSTKYISVGLSGLAKTIYDMWAKWGTMLVVARLLSGASLLDTKWIASTLFVLIGYTVYYLFIYRYVQGKDVTTNIDLQDSIDDTLMNGTMLIVSQLLSGGSITDPLWIRSTIEILIGYTAYDVGTTHIFSKIYNIIG